MLAVVVVVFVALAVVIVAVGRAGLERTRAQAGADAAALAGAADGPEAAGRLATGNGAELVDIATRGDRVDVVVLRPNSGAVATASARRISGRSVDGGGDRAGLAPAMLAALARADQLLGRSVPVTSGYRSPEHQRRLWERRHLNPYPVASPGTSRHEKGLAVDVPSWFVPRLVVVAADAGLCRPLPLSDPVHFEIC